MSLTAMWAAMGRPARVWVQLPYLEERAASGLLQRTIDAYTRQWNIQVQVARIPGLTWGQAQNVLRATAPDDTDYIVMGCDDAIPHPAAISRAIDFHLETGDWPGCRFLQDGVWLDPSYDGKPHGDETPWTRLFLATPAMFDAVGDLLDLTWFTDIDYCQRIREAGMRIRMVDGYTFDHMDPPRTWQTPGEVERQHAAYLEACAAARRSPLV